MLTQRKKSTTKPPLDLKVLADDMASILERFEAKRGLLLHERLDSLKETSLKTVASIQAVYESMPLQTSGVKPTAPLANQAKAAIRKADATAFRAVKRQVQQTQVTRAAYQWRKTQQQSLQNPEFWAGCLRNVKPKQHLAFAELRQFVSRYGDLAHCASEGLVQLATVVLPGLEAYLALARLELRHLAKQLPDEIKEPFKAFLHKLESWLNAKRKTVARAMAARLMVASKHQDSHYDDVLVDSITTLNQLGGLETPFAVPTPTRGLKPKHIPLFQDYIGRYADASTRNDVKAKVAWLTPDAQQALVESQEGLYTLPKTWVRFVPKNRLQRAWQRLRGWPDMSAYAKQHQAAWAKHRLAVMRPLPQTPDAMLTLARTLEALQKQASQAEQALAKQQPKRFKWLRRGKQKRFTAMADVWQQQRLALIEPTLKLMQQVIDSGVQTLMKTGQLADAETYLATLDCSYHLLARMTSHLSLDQLKRYLTLKDSMIKFKAQCQRLPEATAFMLERIRAVNQGQWTSYPKGYLTPLYALADNLQHVDKARFVALQTRCERGRGQALAYLETYLNHIHTKHDITNVEQRAGARTLVFIQKLGTPEDKATLLDQAERLWQRYGALGVREDADDVQLARLEHVLITVASSLGDAWLKAKVQGFAEKRQSDLETFQSECQIVLDANALDEARMQAERIAHRYSEQLWNHIVYALKDHAPSLKRLAEHLPTLKAGKMPAWEPYEKTLFGVDTPAEPPYGWIAKFVALEQRRDALATDSIKACECFYADCEQGMQRLLRQSPPAPCRKALTIDRRASHTPTPCVVRST